MYILLWGLVKYECKYLCCTPLGWQGLNIWMCTLCSSRTDGSLARARHQRVTSDLCFHFFCILSASGKSTDDHSPPPLPVLWWASDRMFRYWGVWIEMPGGNDDGTRFLVGASWCHSVYSLALMWSARANSYWPTPCNLRCADLKKLFHRTNRWLAGLAGLACTSVADAKGSYLSSTWLM